MVRECRALWVLGSGEHGGVGRHALDVARAGIPGWELVFLAPDGPLADEIRRTGASVIWSDVEFGKHAGARRGTLAVRRALRQTGATIVHSHLSWADVITVTAGAGGDLGIVTTEHGIADVTGLYNASIPMAAAKRRLHHWRLRHTDGFIAVSAATDRSVRSQWGLTGTPTQAIIPNGVSEADSRPPRLGARIGVLSRLAPEKRVDLAIRGFAQFRREHPDARLTIAGTGDLGTDLREVARRAGLADSVSFVGHVPDGRLWDDVDVLLQVSWWENCSYAILDAVANGRGVVATDVGGNREIVPPDCLVSSDPSADEIAECLRRQLTFEPALPVDWPSVTEMAGRIAGVYQSVISLR